MKKIVVGLGNPGSRYEKTRHNIGWMVLDRLADRTGSVGRVKARDGAATVRARVDGAELVLVKPTTYMNLSGQAVRKALARERVPMRDLLVVVDDMALPFGRLRIKARGSAGGHNGLRSIISEMESEAFARLRIGIGAPTKGAVEHVLGDFASAEQGHLDLILDAATDAVTLWASDGAEATAARWNGWKPDLPGNGAAPDGSPGPAQEEVMSAPGSAEAPRSKPGEHGIVRTRTGWRKLLPGLLGGSDKDNTA
ncbi:MAG: aminoacyl-tRNA hydrolase [Chloroflexota bacterium]